MKKFEKNDLFYNTIAGNPSYKIVLYNGNVTVNDQISEGNRVSSSVTFLENNFNYTCSVTEEFTKSNVFLDYEFSGTLSYNPTIKRNYIRKAGNTFNYLYTEYLTLKKILALRNVFPKYNLENTNLKISEYLEEDGVPRYKSKVFLDPLSANNYQYYIRPKKDINLIEIPQAFYGNKIQPGTLNLKIYVTGTLVAEASDKYKDTKIIQTSSSFNPSLINAEIGSILYDEGIIILTGSAQLASVSERYIQPVSSSVFNVNFSNAPVSDNLRWVHFGSHKVTTTSVAPGASTPIVSSSFEINFQGSNQVNTLTMFCTADKNDFTWSNNRTFISGGQSDKLLLGQTSSITVNGITHTASSNALFIPSDGKYYENDKIVVKNAISSSFSNYESKYNPQVYISEIAIYNEEGEMIGIAKLANPIRKTKDTDYTIKLKLDI